MTQQPSNKIHELTHYSWTIKLQESVVDQLDIKDINKKTGTRCWVDDTSDYQGSKVLEITGKDEKSVAMAQQIVQRLIRKFRRQNSGDRGNASAMGARSGDIGEELSESIVSEEIDKASALKKMPYRFSPT